MYRLRELKGEDIATINKWRNDKRLIDYLRSPFRYINMDVDRDWYEDYLKSRNKCVRCAIVKDEDEGILGLISLTDIDYINRNGVLHIMVGESQNRGKGIGYFAATEMLNHAFNNLNLNRVELSVLEDNERSIGLWKKLGFKEEGVQRSSVYKNGEFKNMVMMSMLKEEFEEPSVLI